MRYTFPRQTEEPWLCISDFFRSVDSGDPDWASFMVVTMGSGSPRRRRGCSPTTSTSSTSTSTVSGVEMAEALAEYWHRRIREELGLRRRGRAHPDRPVPPEVPRRPLLVGLPGLPRSGGQRQGRRAARRRPHRRGGERGVPAPSGAVDHGHHLPPPPGQVLRGVGDGGVPSRRRRSPVGAGRRPAEPRTRSRSGAAPVARRRPRLAAVARPRRGRPAIGPPRAVHSARPVRTGRLPLESMVLSQLHAGLRGGTGRADQRPAHRHGVRIPIARIPNRPTSSSPPWPPSPASVPYIRLWTDRGGSGQWRQRPGRAPLPHTGCHRARVPSPPGWPPRSRLAGHRAPSPSRAFPGPRATRSRSAHPVHATEQVVVFRAGHYVSMIQLASATSASNPTPLTSSQAITVGYRAVPASPAGRSGRDGPDGPTSVVPPCVAPLPGPASGSGFAAVGARWGLATGGLIAMVVLVLAVAGSLLVVNRAPEPGGPLGARRHLRCVRGPRHPLGGRRRRIPGRAAETGPSGDAPEHPVRSIPSLVPSVEADSRRSAGRRPPRCGPDTGPGASQRVRAPGHYHGWGCKQSPWAPRRSSPSSSGSAIRVGVIAAAVVLLVLVLILRANAHAARSCAEGPASATTTGTWPTTPVGVPPRRPMDGWRPVGCVRLPVVRVLAEGGEEQGKECKGEGPIPATPRPVPSFGPADLAPRDRSPPSTRRPCRGHATGPEDASTATFARHAAPSTAAAPGAGARAPPPRSRPSPPFQPSRPWTIPGQPLPRMRRIRRDRDAGIPMRSAGGPSSFGTAGALDRLQTGSNRAGPRRSRSGSRLHAMPPTPLGRARPSQPPWRPQHHGRRRTPH